MPNRPKNHHYVPIFYLKPWCSERDGRLAEFKRVGPGGRKLFRKRVFPAETGYKPHLYTLPNVEPDSQNWLEETLLNFIDTNSAVARDKLIAYENIKAVTALRDAWSRFIMSSIHRNPEKIEEIGRVWSQGYDELIRDLEPRYDALRQPGDPPDFQSYLASQKPATRERAFANLIKSMMDSEAIGTALNAMRWAVWGFPHTRKTLMTSDRPIVMPHGLAHDDSYVGVAISPRHMFIACNDMQRFEYIRKTISAEKLIAAHNDAVTKQAKNLVYAVDHDAYLFVERRLGHHPVQFIGWTPGGYQPPENRENVLDLIKARAAQRGVQFQDNK